MIVEDIFGNKVNANKFEIHLMRRAEVTDSRDENPVIVLKGYEYFRNKQFQMVKDEAVLKIMPAYEENIVQALRIKEDLVNSQCEINRDTERAVMDIIESGEKSEFLEELSKSIDVSSKTMGLITYLLQKEYQEKQGYRIPRADEFYMGDVRANSGENALDQCENVEGLEPC